MVELKMEDLVKMLETAIRTYEGGNTPRHQIPEKIIETAIKHNKVTKVYTTDPSYDCNCGAYNCWKCNPKFGPS